MSKRKVPVVDAEVVARKVAAMTLGRAAAREARLPDEHAQDRLGAPGPVRGFKRPARPRRENLSADNRSVYLAVAAYNPRQYVRKLRASRGRHPLADRGSLTDPGRARLWFPRHGAADGAGHQAGAHGPAHWSSVCAGLKPVLGGKHHPALPRASTTRSTRSVGPPMPGAT